MICIAMLYNYYVTVILNVTHYYLLHNISVHHVKFSMIQHDP